MKWIELPLDTTECCRGEDCKDRAVGYYCQGFWRGEPCSGIVGQHTFVYCKVCRIFAILGDETLHSAFETYRRGLPNIRS